MRPLRFLAPLIAVAFSIIPIHHLNAATASGLRLIDTSFDILTAAGSSTWDDPVLSGLQGGGHDPNRRGFKLQASEFSLAGEVDPFFRGEAHIVFTPDVVELEEAFGVTTNLPGGLELKAGSFLAPLGRFNPTHPHAWTAIDQPIINTRLFGGDGMRGPGAQLNWLLPLDFYSQIGVAAFQGDGETMGSFLGGEAGEGSADAMLAFVDDQGNVLAVDSGVAEGDLGFAGRPATKRDANANPVIGVLRLNNGFNLGEAEMTLGSSVAFGDNKAGGKTGIYGADLVLKWVAQRNTQGYPFVSLEGEYLERQYFAPSVAFTGSYTDASGVAQSLGYVLPAAMLRDFGATAQLTAGLSPGCKLGLRGEWASGQGDDLQGLQSSGDSRWRNSLRQDRLRLSPLIAWQATHFSRIRLQYNYDFRAVDQGPTTGHTVWLGLELMYGTHPAHNF